MFIHDFIHVPLPAPTVNAHLVVGGAARLADSAGRAHRHGEHLLIRVGPARAAMPSKKVLLTTGIPYARGDSVIVPLFWRATGTSSLFPALEGDLEIAPVGSAVTQISLNATYRPPLGAVGRGADKLLLHRIAEATVREFLAHLAGSLEASAVAV